MVENLASTDQNFNLNSHAQNEKINLLVVDDERTECILIARTAEKAGYKVSTAYTVQSAIHLIKQSKFSFIVLDLQLGEDDGLEVLRVLSELNFDPKPTIIMISGFDERIRTASGRFALQLGLHVGGTLRKPIMPNQLLDILKSTPNFNEKNFNSHTSKITYKELKYGLENNEIYAEFQPKFCLITNRIIGAEALARWKSSKHGFVSPVEFISLAEKTDTIKDITDIILNLSLKAYREWQKYNPECSVAVNISPLQLTDRSLPNQIDAMLKKHNLPASCLIIEVTESAAFSDMIIATEILTRLRIKGIGLSIDDFGTGHASLLSLLNMPFSELKIDRAFVSNCHLQSDAKKIVRSAISLARELGLKVVAEGIEIPEILEVLKESKCDIGQGWLLSRPMSAQAFTHLLSQN